MSVHTRVADERNEEYLEFVSGSWIPRGRRRPYDYLVVKRGKRYRVHVDGSSTAPGPTARAVVVGPFVRRYDPEAGAQEGKPASFDTPQEAIAYVKKYL